MKQLLRTCCLLLFAVALTGCGGSSPTLPRLPADAVVLAFGDSLTFGTGAQAETSYPAVLEKLIGRKVWSAGVPGEVSAAGLARLPSALDFYAGIAKEFGLPLEDAALKTILRDNELKSDVAHPNARGYAGLAEAIATLLKKSGAV